VRPERVTVPVDDAEIPEVHDPWHDRRIRAKAPTANPRGGGVVAH
jgi:hypothetical protein